MTYYPAVFFIMSAVYLAPNIEPWIGNLFGFVLAVLGWYALLKEVKNK